MVRFISLMSLCLLTITLVYSEMFSKKFELTRGTTYNGSAPFSAAVSTTKCITHCLLEETCVAVVYHNRSQNCYMLSSTGSLVETNDVDYAYIYVKGRCTNGWVEFEGSCYLFGDDTYSWIGARDFCQNLAADLVEIETSSENVFVQQTLASVAHDKSWIGMTDTDQEGVWIWSSTGIEAVFLDWGGTTQPNQGFAANCAAIWKSFDYKWVDEPCTNLFHPVCEQVATST